LEARGLGLKVWDAYRPPEAQAALWAVFPDPRYVAPPERGSRHTRGAAVDVTLVDQVGGELEMPSAYDAMGESAGRGWLGGTALARRHVEWLTSAMTGAGFRGIDSEWWHYDDTDWERYPLLTVGFEELEGGRLPVPGEQRQG
jgi:D-alanyl-D-alanine dipeptidase